MSVGSFTSSGDGPAASPSWKKRKLNTTTETIEAYQRQHGLSDDSECSPLMSDDLECSPTLVDKESQTSDQGYGPEFWDLLDMKDPGHNLAQVPSVAALPTASPPATHEPEAWYHCAGFKRRWHKVKRQSSSYPIDWECLNWMPLESFDVCFECIMTFIGEDIGPEIQRFKIGITEDPVKRWNMYQEPRKNKVDWDTMYICYVAPTSKWKWKATDSAGQDKLKKTSTGAMERKLIAGCRCQNNPKLYNTEDGGECPSDGSPHYLYIMTQKLRSDDDMLELIE